MRIQSLERGITASQSAYHARPASGFFSRGGLLVVVVAHAAVFILLLQARVITLPAPLAVLSVSLLSPPVEPAPPKPEIMPPRPKPVAQRPQPTPQPVQLAVPELAPAPTPVVAVPPAPTFTAPGPAPATPAPVQIVQPRFDADYLFNPKPPYPPLSRRLGEQGRVLMRVHVASDGTAGEVQLHTSSGSPRLDQSAMDTLRRWRFVPAKAGNEPVAAWVLVPIAFTLKE